MSNNEITKELFNNVIGFIKNIDIVSNEKSKNYFNISGYPHYENVISNILAFYFDSNEEHGMKDLWVKSLLECCGEETDENIETYMITREESTEDNKRIDLLIESSKHIIVIENKVYSSLDNPLNQYHNSAVKYKKNDQKLVEIVLSINKVNNIERENKKYNTRFINITYKTFIEKVKNNLGKYIVDVSDKWLIFMNELIKNIEEISEENKMEGYAEWEKIISDKENMQNINKLLDVYCENINAKVEYFKTVLQKLQSSSEQKKEILDCTIGGYNLNRDKVDGWFSIYVEFNNNAKKRMVVETWIQRENPCIVTTSLFCRGIYDYDYCEEKDVLEKENCEKVYDKTKWGNFYNLKRFNFTDNFLNEEKLAEEIIKFVGKIRKIS